MSNELTVVENLLTLNNLSHQQLKTIETNLDKLFLIWLEETNEQVDRKIEKIIRKAMTIPSLKISNQLLYDYVINLLDQHDDNTLTNFLTNKTIQFSDEEKIIIMTHAITINSSVMIIKLLIDKLNIHPNLRGEYTSTFLTIASLENKPKIVNVLLENGADPSIDNFKAVDKSISKPKTLEALLRDQRVQTHYSNPLNRQHIHCKSSLLLILKYCS